MVYELIIIIIASIFLTFVFRKYLERRHKLTLYLFIIFLNFVVALIFSWLSKFLRLYSGLEYLVDPLAPDPMTVESWFLLRIVSFRFTMIFTIVALLYNYILKINLFETEESTYSKIYNYIIYGYAGGSILCISKEITFRIFIFILYAAFYNTHFHNISIQERKH